MTGLYHIRSYAEENNNVPNVSDVHRTVEILTKSIFCGLIYMIAFVKY